MIDTHAHISRRFGSNIDKIVNGAKMAGIDQIILAASNVEESEENIKLAMEYPIFKAAVGVHPQQTDTEITLTIDEQISKLDELAGNDKVVAIGECGLDFSPPPPEERERPVKEQEILLRGQIAVAVKHKLPLIIHARKAVDETIALLAPFQKKLNGGVFHCYAGGKKRISKLLELGDNWYFGFDGNLTYEVGLAEVVASIPKDRIILETDSPFLTPAPYRGETNKPEYVKYIYQKLSLIWELSLEETEKIVDRNAKSLFKLL